VHQGSHLLRFLVPILFRSLHISVCQKLSPLRQGVAIAVLAHFGIIVGHGAWTTDNVAAAAQDFIICIEVQIALDISFFLSPLPTKQSRCSL
jgi:hypothetical protein